MLNVVTRRCLLLLPLLGLVLEVGMFGLVASLVVKRHCTPVPHARVAEMEVFNIYCNEIQKCLPQIVHGRVEMAQGSTSISLLLHRNRSIASVTMWLRNWRGRHGRS